jgi:hypothetical protein
MESTPGNWTCIALAVLLASAPPMSFAEPAATGDARHCLDLGSDQAIVQCAEQYRPGGSRSAGKARRDAATAAAAAPAAPAPALQRVESTPKASPDPAPPPAPKRKSRKRVADARHCLDLESMAAIARCAEKYR